MTANPPQGRIGLWLTLVVGFLYCLWLGAHWLPLPMSDRELAASASRVWDVQQELRAGHGVPWWTPNFMSGSSYGLNYARGLYLVPWLLVAQFTDLITAGKLIALAAMFASAVAMFCCARYFLKNDWAAALAAIVFLLHPQQLARAAGSEHLTIVLAFPFWPLLWLTLARALDTGRLRDALLCALSGAFAWWADNKQALIIFVFLLFYLLYRLGTQRDAVKSALRQCGLTGAAFLVLAAFPLVTGLTEARHVKLFAGDPVVEWQKTYAFKSLLALVDRNGAMTRQAITGVQQHAPPAGVHSQTEFDQIRRIFSLPMDSPEKYAGVVALALVAVTALFNRQRINRRLFWFFLGLLLASIALAGGLSNLWEANWQTFDAIFSLPTGVAQLGAFLAGGVAVAGLILFARRKLTTPRKWIIAGVILGAFLFLPAFRLISALPYFGDIRAPFVFYDLPATFLLAMLAGFFVTDVLTTRVPLWVAGMTVLLLLDYWPYQQPMKDNGVPARTIQNLEATYRSLRADPEWVKTYAFSGRYFHLLGPMYSGKPQVWEAFYNWQAPAGMGQLNQNLTGATLNLVGARYLVFDKTDPGANQQFLAQLRQVYPVFNENEDFVVFRNNAAHNYVTGQFVPLTGVELTRVNHGTIRIGATAPQPGVAVIAESWYPFWRATVDGQPVEVWKVNTGLMGVNLPVGAHQIELRYVPPRAYSVAAGISLLGLAGVGVSLLRAPSRRT